MTVRKVVAIVLVLALVAIVPLAGPPNNLDSTALAYGLLHLLDDDIVAIAIGGAGAGATVWAATRLGVRIGGTVGGFFGALIGGAAAAL